MTTPPRLLGDPADAADAFGGVKAPARVARRDGRSPALKRLLRRWLYDPRGEGTVTVPEVRPLLHRWIAHTLRLRRSRDAWRRAALAWEASYHALLREHIP